MTPITVEIANICEILSEEQRAQVLDFAQLLLAHKDGDAAWERIIADPKPRPKLDAFLKAAREEGEAEPLDLNRLSRSGE